MSSYELALALGILAPFVSFWILVFFGPRLGKPLAGWTGVVLGMGVPLLCASYALIGWWLFEDPNSRSQLTDYAARWTWAYLGDVPLTVGVKLDSLTVAMYFMVAFVAFWIFVFSVGYMAGHSDEVDHRSLYHRFFAYLSLFGFSMLGLVVSSSLLFLFIFWELVGLCSYLLIGFYFDRQYASRAAMKAFITNRVGDFGFLIGMMLVFFYLNTLDLDGAARNFAAQYQNGSGIFASSFTLFGLSLATLMGIGLFCGAMGKSAQFPLHVWLPDAMAGPTPVSALIHAATMVAAGVYLVARVFRLMTPDALMFIALIGCLTLTLMALIAIVQTDIKKCLAYSTLSQLGYMIFGMGCGAWIAALFHLITHAFFKAMLFLGSGQVIEGCHHEQDMRKMGGLRKKMPVTCWTFFVGVLAIAGFGIPGTPVGLGGFFSKDEILAASYARAFEWDDPKKHADDHGGEHHSAGMTHDAARHAERSEASPALQSPEEPEILRFAQGDTGRLAQDEKRPASTQPPVRVRLAFDPAERTQDQTHGVAGHGSVHEDEGQATHDKHPGDLASIFSGIRPLPKWMFYLALFTAYVTPFYMMRAWWMTFMGKPRDTHVYDHAHESPLMYIPLVVLAGGTLFSSYWLFRPMIADASQAASAASMVLPLDGHSHTPAIHHAHQFLIWGVGFAFVIGFAIAIAIYRNGLDTARSIAALPVVRQAKIVLEHKYYFDEVYDLVFVKGTIVVAKICRFIDTWIVDFIFNLVAFGTERLASFSGWVLDAQGIDGIYNGMSKTALDIGNAVRQPQTGRIRNYVLITAGVATVVLLALLIAYGTDREIVAAAANGLPTIE